MKKYGVVILLMLLGIPEASALAASPPPLAAPPGLTLAEIKITGNEFVILQNNTGSTISDLSNYWLYVFNNVNPLAAGVSSSSQQLPSGSLASGQFALLSASGGNTCGATTTGKLSLSLNDSGGFLQVVQNSLSGGLLVQTTGDALSWSSGTNSTAGMISNLPSNSSAPNSAYYRYQNTADGGAPYLWQLANLDVANPCQLNVTLSGSTSPAPTGGLIAGTAPPATIISLTDEEDTSVPATGSLPAADVGLAAPQINELLPNPAEPQTDSEDEFIELYNSNDAAFDLTGFKLQTGTTTLHNYTFPVGTALLPKSFTAFSSIDTNLSLANSGGQARLLDPSGNIISQSDSYVNAPEGQSWALASGKWYWTTTPTSGGANVINQPLSVKELSVGAALAATSGTAKKASSGSASAAKTTAAPKTKSSTTTNSTPSPGQPKPNTSPLHPLVLAVVGVGAVGYAAYEYRNDLANRFYQFRRYRAARATAGATIKKS